MCTVLFLSLADVGRSLQAWQQHGRPHSELLRSQRDSEGGSTLGGPLRYAGRTLIFWVQCQQVLYYYYSSAFFFSKTLCRFIDWSSSSIYIQVMIITLEGEKPVENKRGKTGSPAINGLLQVRSCIGVATCSLLHWKVFFRSIISVAQCRRLTI